ncbi:RHOMBOID-like protein 3 isoform X1 [Rhodamnia argentea]|uniref:RHOMBOID-like protein n=1 Tax=Rhodamnia argentea TaxID=178133 RepID=A0A8B8PDK3_9MYRT|nr:RHOMBOID-like protein 3 isoform X1 [Rhodamnia argentea]
MAAVDIESRGGGPEKNVSRSSNNYSSSSSFVVDDSDAQWTSWLMPMFVVANIAVFVVMMYVNDCPKHHRTGGCVAKFLGRFSFEPLRLNPLFGPSNPTLDKLGALDWEKVVHRHQGWRLVTCIWLHAGVIHVAVNMLCLILIGVRLEQQFGFVRIGIIFLLSGFGGSVLSALFIQHIVTVGASGALFGLLGAMLSELLTNWSLYTNKAAALVTLAFVIAVNLAIGILPHVNNFAHIGGFLTGFLLGFILLPRPQLAWLDHRNLPADVPVKSKYKAYQYVFWLASLLLLLAGFTVALVMLFRGKNGNDHCHWCHYLSCVPTNSWSCDGN